MELIKSEEGGKRERGKEGFTSIELNFHLLLTLQGEYNNSQNVRQTLQTYFYFISNLLFKLKKKLFFSVCTPIRKYL